MSASGSFSQKPRTVPPRVSFVRRYLGWFSIGPALGLLFWCISLPLVNTTHITEAGLVTGLPPTYFVSLLVLCLSFAVLIVENPRSLWPWTLHVLVLVLVLHGTLPFIYEVSRLPWTFKHVGVTSFIQTFGSVDPTVDAYHNWPGFFALAALITSWLGFGTALELSKWAQLAFNLLYFVPLVFVARSVTPSRRRVWLTVWLFYLTSWVCQDYFAPQAIGYFFYLVILGLLLTWFSRIDEPVRVPRPTDRLPVKIWIVLFGPRIRSPLNPSERWLLIALLVLFTAIVASHQLTPFMLISSLLLLTIFRRTRVPWLILLAVGITAFWDATFARTFMTEHNNWYATLGNFLKNLTSSPATTRAESEARTLLTTVPRIFTYFVWALAVAGVAQLRRSGQLPVRVMLLAVAPFPLVLVHSYGGEMLLRAYFFSLPLMTALAASVLTLSRFKRSRTTLLALTSMITAAGFIITYFLNERMYRVPAEYVSLSSQLLKRAPSGSLMVSVSVHNLPLTVEPNYGEFTYYPLVDVLFDHKQHLEPASIDQLEQVGASLKAPATYVIFTANEQGFYALGDTVTPDRYRQAWAYIKNSSRWQEFLRVGDSVVYVSLHSKPGGLP